MSEVLDIQTGKRELTKATNRQTILNAARVVFGELGFDAATVRDIIRRTNLSVGAFYNYYRSKEEVFDALADDGARRFRPILHAQAAKATDFESYLRAAVRAYFDFIAEEHSDLAAFGMARREVAHPRTDTPEMMAVYAEVRQALADVLDRGLAPKVDLDYLATSCIAVAREVGDQMLIREHVDVAGATEFVVRLILGGVRALPGAGG
ncbi:MAG: TetR/AcrR family transcriptional regulator [Caulobacteraceae bacterium]|jgi:AcrR family transcriptional regulator